MKEIRILCVGKIKEKYFKEGIEEYLKIIRKSYPISVQECMDEPTPDKASPAEEELIKEREGRRILSHISEEDYVVALCIDGRHYDSRHWKKHMYQIRERISGSLIFVIGGSLGLSESVVRRADERFSFSAMTFPHQMMRMMLLAQIAAWSSVQY